MQREQFLVHPTAPDSAYRTGVGIILINARNKVFVGCRADLDRNDKNLFPWQLPQGGVDYGEDPYVAVLREMKEEIGTDQVTLVDETSDWIYYNLPEEIAAKLWGGRFIGQKQKWYVFRYDGYDADINIHTSHPEFCEWKWVHASELPNLIVSFKKNLYLYLMDYFKDHLGLN